MRYAIIMAALLLGGCASTGSLVSLQPVCEALGDPVPYNSRNPASSWHAGKDLAQVLNQRNQVGVNLSCPAYK